MSLSEHLCDGTVMHVLGYWKLYSTLEYLHSNNRIVKEQISVESLILKHKAPNIFLLYSINALQCPALKVFSNMCCSLRIT